MPSYTWTQDSFNGGEISKGLRSTTRLEKYYSSCERIKNFIITKEGNARYREGFKYTNGTKSNNLGVQKTFVSVDNKKYLLSFTNGYLTIFRDNTQVSEIASPYTESNLYNIQHAQEKDTMYLCDGIHTDYKLIQTATDTFTLTRVDYDSYTPPFIQENLTLTTIQASATTGSITLTASASLFLATDIGRYIKIRSGASSGWARMTGYTSDLIVSATVVSTLPTTSAVDTWSFSPAPTSVCFFQGRRYIVSITNIWGSKVPSDDGTTNYDDFTLGSAIEDAVIFTSALLSPGARWIANNDKTIFCASKSRVLDLSPADTSNIISIDNPPEFKTIATDGSSTIPVIIKNNVIFFINDTGKRLNTINYNFEIDGYEIIDINLLSNEILGSNVVQIAMQEGIENIVWCVNSSGLLLGINYLPSQSVVPWFRVKTEGIIESIATLPRDQGGDRLYIIVKRTINGSDVRYIEYLDDYVTVPDILDYYTDENSEESDREEYEFDTWQVQKEYNNVDSFITFDGSDSTHSTQTMTPSAITGDEVSFKAGGSLFVSGDVGREIWEKESTGIAKIIEYVSTTEVKCKIISAFASTSTIPAGSWYFTKNTFTGLNHLEGKEVTIISDGFEVSGTYTVSSGSVTIPKQASQTTIGLKYTGLIKSMCLQGGSMKGNSRIKKHKVDRFAVSMRDSIGGEIGTNIYRLAKILYGPPQINGRAILPFTGLKEITIDDNYEQEKNIYVLQKLSLPFTIQLLTADVETNEQS